MCATVRPLQAAGLWRNDENEIVYTDTLELDIGTVNPVWLAQTRQDRVYLNDMKSQFLDDLGHTYGVEGGPRSVDFELDGKTYSV